MNSEIIKIITVSLYIKLNKQIVHYKKSTNKRQQTKYNKDNNKEININKPMRIFIKDF